MTVKGKRRLVANKLFNLLMLLVMSNRSDEENCVVCTCGQPALKLTVKKDGPNKGKINEAYLTPVQLQIVRSSYRMPA